MVQLQAQAQATVAHPRPARHLSRIKTISDAAHALNTRRSRAELATQALDVCVDGTRADTALVTPHGSQKSLSRLDTRSGITERAQETKLERRDVSVSPVNEDAMRGQVDVQKLGR
jgi:hypothetical protein